MLIIRYINTDKRQRFRSF